MHGCHATEPRSMHAAPRRAQPQAVNTGAVVRGRAAALHDLRWTGTC